MIDLNLPPKKNKRECVIKREWEVTHRTPLMSCALVAMVFAAAAAQAQDASTAPSADAEATDFQDGDIVVTAQRRSQRLQDVPVTLTAFGAEQIAESRIQSVDDVALRTPGLNFDAFPPTQPRPFVRGIGSSDRGAAGDPSTAAFLDEVYLGRPAAVAFDVFDIERIEVLKGPQGTLWGKNVVGGAISVITRKPQLDRFDAGAEVSYGNYDAIDLAGFVNVPFAQGTGALRVASSFRQHDGYTPNLFTGNRLDDAETFSVRAQVAAEPRDGVSFLIGGDYTRDRALGPAKHVTDRDLSSSRGLFWTIDPDRDYTKSETDGFQNRDTWGVRGQATIDIGFADLNFIASYRELEYDYLEDIDGGNPTFNLVNITATNTEESRFSSEELRLSSHAGSPFSWIVGLYHFNQSTSRQDTLFLDQRATLSAPVVFNRRDIIDQFAKTDSYAAFVDITVPLTSTIEAFGGARYSYDTKDFSISNRKSVAPLRATELYAITADDSWGSFTFRGGVNYKPSRDLMFYALVSRGYKSGGFQDTPTTGISAATPFAPEQATLYEIGQKGTFFGGRLIFNNTLFWTDYTNMQVRQTVGTQTFTTNAGSSVIKGYETQVSLRPVRGVELNAGYAYTDARFKVFFDRTTDLSGNRISRNPEHKLTISPAFTYPFANGSELRLSGDYVYESFVFDDNDNSCCEYREPKNVFDVRLSYKMENPDVTLSLWGKNITNEVYRTWQTGFFNGNFATYAPPRTYGFSARWSY